MSVSSVAVRVVTTTGVAVLAAPETVGVQVVQTAITPLGVVPVGPQGPPGSGGAGDYLLHDQTTPTASITVTHGFGRRPVVSVLLGEVEVDTDVEHVSVDAVSFVFPSPTAFKAILTS